MSDIFSAMFPRIEKDKPKRRKPVAKNNPQPLYLPKVMLCVASPPSSTRSKSPRLKHRSLSGRKIYLPQPVNVVPRTCPKPQEDPGDKLSLGEVYTSMEKERCLSSKQRRREIIEYAQKRAASGGSSRMGSRHTEDTHSMMMESRPTTALSVMSRKTFSEVNQASQSLSEEDKQLALTSRTTMSTPSKPMWNTRSRICSRSRSAIERELDGMVNCLSRQCCDVLGPRTCHQCAMINRRVVDTKKQESRSIVFPNLHVSGENFCTALMVAKACPHLDPYQIQTHIVCGEVMRPGIRRSLELRKEITKREEHAEEYQSEDKTKVAENKSSALRKPAMNGQSKFFSSLQDLDAKLIAGKMSKNLKAALVENEHTENESAKKSVLQELSFSETINPAFVSPKRVEPQKEFAYKAFYQPPLVPKVCQSVEPSFFAGVDSDYILPDRLPRQPIIEADTPSRPSTAVSFTSSGGQEDWGESTTPETHSP